MSSFGNKDDRPSILLLCDFSIENPPDFLHQQLRLIPNELVVWLVARQTKNSPLNMADAATQLIEYKDSKIDYILYRFFRRFKFIRGVETIFQPHSTMKIFALILKTKPKIVHVHGLGGRMFPTILIPLVRLLTKCEVIITHHGFSPLNAGLKLYPNELQRLANFSVSKMLEDWLTNVSPANNQKDYSLNLSSRLLRFTVWLINHATINIAISNMQSNIFALYGIRVDCVIHNSCTICSCSTNDSETNLPHIKNEKIGILFSGRPIGKGLERVVNLAKRNEKIHLFLVGYAASEEFVKLSGLQSNQYTFLGYVKKDFLYPLIHSMHFVSCLSDCFDNFPTVALEAIYHGSIPIVSSSTGVSEIIHSINPQMVWPSHSNFDDELLEKLLSNRKQILSAIGNSDFNDYFTQSALKLTDIYRQAMKQG